MTRAVWCSTTARGTTARHRMGDTRCRHTSSANYRDPLGRTDDPMDIAEATVFLASPRASYPTGATVAADGGYTAI